ncbi:hypothetical protein PENTCL1PPCAC_28092 [Pristionchus entomophagus]|uniref:Ribosomal protein n=1 Tax=Pristionchus entomophagus TaxID=358040 RepID=A0AAV5UHW2_9BILA|nr:hypothetical protein PENTCL1PPCAC_28092 [Pristionchus entomophagus]
MHRTEALLRKFLSETDLSHRRLSVQKKIRKRPCWQWQRREVDSDGILRSIPRTAGVCEYQCSFLTKTQWSRCT